MNTIIPIILLSSTCLAGCLQSTSDGSEDAATSILDDISIGKIYWSDGDSGRLEGIAFRLHNIDAPETGGVGAAIGGAKCELERERGYEAKAFIVSLTENAAIKVTHNYGPDKYDRYVVDLNADGIDVAEAGMEAGLFRPWLFDENGRALMNKPTWCEN